MKKDLMVAAALAGMQLFCSLAMAQKQLTKADLNDATRIVYEGYGKEKFDVVAKKVEAKLGPAHKSEPNLKSWFAKDGEKCIQFWITSTDKGFAATNMADDTVDAKNGCKGK